ncbi:MAG: rhodanese-like domain-containing protein [Desulfurivibrio sp.]|nr:MAG: rhodanese-like domain-containing protein [Desulfurivibrio sp.]
MTGTTSPNRILVALLLLSLLMLPWSAHAAEAEPSLEGYKEISAFELKQLADSDQQALIINVLSAIEYDSQHIPGSINIPIINMKNTSRLPRDKNTPLVFYCLSDR